MEVYFILILVKLMSKEDKAVYEEAQKISEEKRFFHWDLEFPEVFIDLDNASWKENAGFDAVVGNPPYVSAWSMTDNDRLTRRSIETLFARENLLSGHWDIYVAFLIKAYIICQETGAFSYIIPNPFCREKYASKVRQFFIMKTEISHILPFGEENVFEDVSRQTLVIVICKREPSESSSIYIDNSYSPMHKDKEIFLTLPQAIFSEIPDFQIRYDIKSEEIKIFKKIDILSFRLGNVCYVNYGAQISSKEKGKFRKSDVIFYENTGNYKKFFDGKNIARYEIEWNGRYLNYKSDEMYGSRTPELFQSPKIVIRDVTGKNETLIVSFDNTGLYCDHLIICATYYNNLGEEGIKSNFEGFIKLEPPLPDLLYITGMLASKITTWYFRILFATSTLQGSYSHTYPQQIRAFPIRKINFTTPHDRRQKSLENAIALYNQYQTNDNSEPILSQIDDHLNQQPEEADVIHDLLAYLAEQMLELNKQKQAEIKSFLQWLERFLGCPIDSLTNKSKIQNYLGDYYKNEPHISFDELTAVLKKNKKKIKIDPVARKEQQTLEKEYQDSLKTLLPLKTQLLRCDQLIDAIVYKLYGLTEEEIAIVEGR